MRQEGSQARIRGAASPKRQAEGEGPAEENDWMITDSRAMVWKSREWN